MNSSSSDLQRFLREPFNSISHFIGILLSILGLVLLVVLSNGEPYRTTSFAIYGSSLIILYTASTLLHSIKTTPKTEKKLRIFDHAAIFILIAGSYTPIALVTLQKNHPAWGWSLLSVVWGIALLGVLFKVFWIEAPRWLSTALYLGMGWMSLVVITPVAQTLALGGMVWLGLGGAFYSVGAVIYALKKPDFFPKVFGYHELWHLFVLAGSFCHFMMMLRYVLPA
ncbi:MAG: PAQR family membrane homeostasis protein TrhA [Trueperaceae bacterium]